jgi:hypothetical protein
MDVTTVISLQFKVTSIAVNTQHGLLGPVFISPSDRVAQLYPQVPGSLFDTFYISQGYGEGILTHLHMECRGFALEQKYRKGIVVFQD